MSNEIKDQPGAEEGGHPIGTLVLLLIYLVVIIGIWGSVYVILIQRA